MSRLEHYLCLINKNKGSILFICHWFERIARNSWFPLWLESDSTLVIQSFDKSNLVPWKLQNTWLSCLSFTKSRSFKVTHIYRERKCKSNYRWDLVPSFCAHYYVWDFLGQPKYMFCNSWHGSWFSLPMLVLFLHSVNNSFGLRLK